MLSQVIWWVSITLEVVLLVRALRGDLARRYPIFYMYISFVLLQSLARFLVYQWDRGLYPNFYWTTEIFGVLVGCAVVFEICKVILSAYSGTARMARKLLAFVFVLAVAKALVTASTNPGWWGVSTSLDLELSLRIVQAVAILALFALFLFYSIPVGRNLRGMLLGYALFVGMSIVQLTFAATAGPSFEKFWTHVHPISYDLVLCIWVSHLWSYREIPVPQAAVHLERQYQRVAAATTRRLRDARGYLGRLVQP